MFYNGTDFRKIIYLDYLTTSIVEINIEKLIVEKNIQAAESEEIALSGTMPPIEKMDARLDSNIKIEHYYHIICILTGFSMNKKR